MQNTRPLRFRTSKHFSTERQSRGVSSRQIWLWAHYGKRCYAIGGAYRYHLTDAAIDHMRRDGVEPKVVDFAEKKQNYQLVVAHDGCVITGMYCNNKHKRIRNRNKIRHERKKRTYAFI